jgi:hypothetical protein
MSNQRPHARPQVATPMAAAVLGLADWFRGLNEAGGNHGIIIRVWYFRTGWWWSGWHWTRWIPDFAWAYPRFIGQLR